MVVVRHDSASYGSLNVRAPGVMMWCSGGVDRTHMESLNAASSEALREILANQPTTSAKVTFAWRMAAGPALARATEALWRDDGVLTVRARTDAWRRELRRAQPVLLARVRQLIGQGTVRKLIIE